MELMEKANTFSDGKGFLSNWNLGIFSNLSHIPWNWWKRQTRFLMERVSYQTGMSWIMSQVILRSIFFTCSEFLTLKIMNISCESIQNFTLILLFLWNYPLIVSYERLYKPSHLLSNTKLLLHNCLKIKDVLFSSFASIHSRALELHGWICKLLDQVSWLLNLAKKQEAEELTFATPCYLFVSSFAQQ